MEQLNFRQMLKLATISKKLKIKDIVKEVFSNEFDKELKAMTIFETVEGKEVETLESIVNKRKYILSCFGIALFENLENVEKELSEFIANIKNTTPDKVLNEFTIDDVAEIMTDILFGVLPKNMQSMIDINAIKKNIQSILNGLTEQQ